ncbi:conserved protein of unknown function [Rhodovastum atsumiense]|uniref:Uncharacterized protein n=1 Tax=Rhodovastum atsumiense TaxID=504468 RepID=A0A5M6IQS7_9PROT|nr:hypothetical protein [Rhodovastum atsumiense]KAA5610634.1 hypothetical protein F1189_18610 [Rhodovastum atsumiense]CAH2600757.1 conserved protein of unknown function [Rhodovastum atsumiense]
MTRQVLTSPSFLQCDRDWLEFASARATEITAELQQTFLKPCALAIQERSEAERYVVAASAADFPLDDFQKQLATMARGMEMAAAAEEKYQNAIRTFLLSNETWGNLLLRYVGSLFAPEARETVRSELSEKLSGASVDPRTAQEHFRLERAPALELVANAGEHAALWMVEAWLTALLQDRLPNTAVLEAAGGYAQAVKPRRAVFGRNLDLKVAGRRCRLELQVPERTKKPPVLIWPAVLGADLPAAVDKPLDWAVKVGASHVEFTDETCVMDVGQWVVRLPLSIAGKAFLADMARKLGQQETMFFSFAGVPEGAESLRLFRERISLDRYRYTVSLYYPVQAPILKPKVA